MRMLAAVFCVALFVLVMVNLGTGQEKTDPTKVTYDFSFFEKQYGLKMKSFGPTKDPKEAGSYSGILEFGKDLPEAQTKELQDALSNGAKKVRVLFFDEDNVVFSSPVFLNLLKGEISGIKGDAFRVFVTINEPPQMLEKIRKVVVRPTYKVAPSDEEKFVAEKDAATLQKKDDQVEIIFRSGTPRSVEPSEKDGVIAKANGKKIVFVQTVDCPSEERIIEFTVRGINDRKEAKEAKIRITVAKKR